MKKTILLFIVLFGFIAKSNAQDSGISFEVHYPYIVNDTLNRYSENQGVLGGNLQFQFTDNVPFNFGIEYRFDLIQAVEQLSEFNEPAKRTFLINNINLFSKMQLVTLPELKIVVDGGFTQYKYDKGQGRPSALGFNLGGGLNYDIYDKIYAFISYSYIRTRITQNDGHKQRPDNYQLIRIGLGFNL
jgi:hypothetical protein